jgi:hypothetical protein
VGASAHSVGCGGNHGFGVLVVEGVELGEVLLEDVALGEVLCGEGLARVSTARSQGRGVLTIVEVGVSGSGSIDSSDGEEVYWEVAIGGSRSSSGREKM